MVIWLNDRYTIGFILKWRHYIYHLRYSRIGKNWEIGRQWL